jgi:hypothetical protein
MASKDSLEVRNILAKGVAVWKGTDAPVALRLRYRGTGTVTSVAVITATHVQTITSDGGTDTYLFSAYTTMGAVADAINSAGIFECKVLDVLRSAASDDALLAATLTTTTLDEENNAVYDLVVDTSGMFGISVCLSNNRGFGKAETGHRVHLQEIIYLANVNAVAVDQLRVTARKGAKERLLLAMPSVDNTLTDVTFAGGAGYISSDEDEEIIVSIKDATSLANGCYMRVIGLIE